MEVYKNIIGCTGYQVSSLGNVKSLKNGQERILKPYKNNRGEMCFVFSIGLSIKCYTVESLVALHFGV